MRLVVLSSAGVALASMFVWVACSSSSTPSPSTTPDAGPTGDAAPSGPFTLAIPCTDTIDSIYGDPGALPAAKGAILKCAPDEDISMASLLSRAKADVTTDPAPATNIGYTGKAFTSGAHTYRILYRTERGDTASSAGYSSAKVFIPDTPRTSATLPLLVGARGSRGQAAACAASKEDPAAVAVNSDYESLAFPMVGFGMPIIVPDLAGYANFGAAGNPISGYAQYQDVAKSTLDAARAFQKMFPHAFNGKVAIIGHSQGGHSMFASVALQPTYAPEIKIAAVAAYSPLWISQASWAALLYEASSYPLATSPSANAVSVWYHYTHGELLDGPGHGIDVFAPAAQAAVSHFINNDCWGAGYNGVDAGTTYPDLQAVAKTPLDLFDPSFVTSVQNSAALGNPCPMLADGGGVDPVCAKWTARYANDRPHLSNTPPILIEYGMDDVTISPPLMACVVDRLKNQDKVPFTFCLDPLYGHTSIVRAHADYVAQWVASQTLGEAAPAACSLSDTNLVDDAGTAIQCAEPPPNDK